MHFGMADLSIFRFARSMGSGGAPAIGMFLGHYMACLLSVVVGLYLIFQHGLFAAYAVIPCWIVCGVNLPTTCGQSVKIVNYSQAGGPIDDNAS